MTRLVLLAACLALARGRTTFAGFQRKHVDFPKTTAQNDRVYCNEMMQSRGMTWPVSKGNNTVVHSTVQPIVAICVSGATPAYGNLQDSVASLPLTVCRQLGREHVDFPKTRAQNVRLYCNLMMQSRGMTWPSCKDTNTFIHSTVGAIVAVCGSGGTPAYGNLRDSVASFPLTVCRWLGGSPRPPCCYDGYTITQRIRIACERGRPVHFETQMSPRLGA